LTASKYFNILAPWANCIHELGVLKVIAPHISHIFNKSSFTRIFYCHPYCAARFWLMKCFGLMMFVQCNKWTMPKNFW